MTRKEIKNLRKEVLKISTVARDYCPAIRLTARILWLNFVCLGGPLYAISGISMSFMVADWDMITGSEHST